MILKTMKRAGVLIALVLMVIAMLAVPASAATKDNTTSLWSKNTYLKSIKFEPTGDVHSGDMKKYMKKIKTYTDRYSLVDSGNTNIPGSIGYSLTSFFYTATNNLGQYAMDATYFSKNIGLVDRFVQGTGKRTLNSYKRFYQTRDFLALLALASILVGFIGLIYILMGRTSKGFGRILSMLAVIAICILFYGNAATILKTTSDLTGGIADTVGGAFNLKVGKSGGGDIYHSVMDNLVVKPYNQAQYGEADPLESGGSMSKNPTTYNYMLTWKKIGKNGSGNEILFGKYSGKIKKMYQSSKEGKYTGYSKFDSLPDGKRQHSVFAEDVHQATAEDFAGESQTGGIWTYQVGSCFDELKYADGKDGVTGGQSTPYQVTISGSNVSSFDDYFANTPKHWMGTAGQMFIMVLISLVLFVIFIALALLSIGGEILVILMVLLGPIMVLLALFKGMGPLRVMFSYGLLGFGMEIVAEAMRNITILLMNIFSSMANDNVIIELLLMIAAFVVLKRVVPQLMKSMGFKTGRVKDMTPVKEAKLAGALVGGTVGAGVASGVNAVRNRHAKENAEESTEEPKANPSLRSKVSKKDADIAKEDNAGEAKTEPLYTNEGNRAADDREVETKDSPDETSETGDKLKDETVDNVERKDSAEDEPEEPETGDTPQAKEDHKGDEEPETGDTPQTREEEPSEEEPETGDTPQGRKEPETSDNPEGHKTDEKPETGNNPQPKGEDKVDKVERKDSAQPKVQPTDEPAERVKGFKPENAQPEKMAQPKVETAESAQPEKTVRPEVGTTDNVENGLEARQSEIEVDDPDFPDTGNTTRVETPKIETEDGVEREGMPRAETPEMPTLKSDQPLQGTVRKPEPVTDNPTPRTTPEWNTPKKAENLAERAEKPTERTEERPDKHARRKVEPRKKPDTKRPEVKKPEVKKPEVKKPEVKKPKKPTVKKPVTKKAK